MCFYGFFRLIRDGVANAEELAQYSNESSSSSNLLQTSSSSHHRHHHDVQLQQANIALHESGNGRASSLSLQGSDSASFATAAAAAGHLDSQSTSSAADRDLQENLALVSNTYSF